MSAPVDPSPMTSEFRWDVRPDSAPSAAEQATAVQRLNAAWGLIANPPAFAVGDLVTPRHGFTGAGTPHVVIGLDDVSHRDREGRLVDHTMRVIWLQHDVVRSAWVERWRFDWWSAPAPEGAARQAVGAAA